MRAERLLIKTIKEEKIKKAYHVAPSQSKHEPDRLLMFEFKNGHDNKS